MSPHTYTIASIPGDGIGREVTEQAICVLKKVEALSNSFTLRFDHFDWSSASYQERGYYIPDGGLRALKAYDAILFGAVGSRGMSQERLGK